MALPDQPVSPATTLSSEFCWDMVVFKVEHTIFRVLRHEFTAASPFFETMFLLPSAEGEPKVEGRTNDNPIVLEGYKAADFDALLRVLYPSSRTLLSGGVVLTKEQWIGVLRLSTIWDMKEIRQFAVQMISNDTPPLTALEKVALGSDHQISSWLIEGLTHLALDRDVSPEALEKDLGLRSAFRLCTIRLKLFPGAKARPLLLSGNTYTGFAIDDLRYPCCYKPFVKDKVWACHCCSRLLPAKVAGSVYIKSTPNLRSSEKHIYILFKAAELMCASCHGQFIPVQPTTCQSCYRPATGCLHVFYGCYLGCTADALVREVFQDDIKEYDA